MGQLRPGRLARVAPIFLFPSIWGPSCKPGQEALHLLTKLLSTIIFLISTQGLSRGRGLRVASLEVPIANRQTSIKVLWLLCPASAVGTPASLFTSHGAPGPPRASGPQRHRGARNKGLNRRMVYPTLPLCGQAPPA